MNKVHKQVCTSIVVELHPWSSWVGFFSFCLLVVPACEAGSGLVNPKTLLESRVPTTAVQSSNQASTPKLRIPTTQVDKSAKKVERQTGKHTER